MAKRKKPPPAGSRGPRQPEGSWQPLSEPEIEISLVCLKYFRGEWDTYLDFLRGPRVAGIQKQREIPLVERLKERDFQTDYLTYFLEDEIVHILEHLSFDGLMRLWEYALLVHPEADPFPDRPDHSAADATQSSTIKDGPSTLH